VKPTVSEGSHYGSEVSAVAASRVLYEPAPGSRARFAFRAP
jgi:hypothetical protein